ncbi:Ger(x)C family spore germination protein [Bacillus aerolatus]|uniref:Ger(X)C family spore germination protein n=1 Tax=Bacillus aerolatus TaxID=2653354 RepID=A0A6I1FWE8_9BACI|nr:Ger(x)C family spore germination protein [Bacillus aerolatus]KAB7707353.1 Ger(x)C family spore germination protein [Bacillus aerolatus]
MKKYILLFLCLILSGCVNKSIIDEVDIERGVGYDEASDNKIRGTILLSKYNEDGTTENVTMTVVDETSVNILSRLQRQSDSTIVYGSLKLVIFSEAIAKKDLIEISDAFVRDARLGSRMYFVISEGSAQKVLKGEYGDHGNATFISDALDHNIKHGDVPKTNLHLFVYDYTQKGRTAYLPIIKKLNQQRIDISAIGLLDRQGHLVDKVSVKDMFYLKLLVDKYSGGSQVVKLDGDRATIRSIHSKNKIKISKRNPLEMSINIKVEGIIQEYRGKKLTQKKIEQFEKKFAEEINQNTTKLIKRFQQLGIDPAGLGHNAKQQTRNFDFKKWDDEYKDLTVHVKTDVTILESGVVQ